MPMNQLSFCPKNWILNQNDVEGETIGAPSTSTGRQIPMESVCLQQYAPLQDGHHVVTRATTI